MFLSILAGISFLVGREIFLVLGVTQIRTSLSLLRQIDKNPKAYGQQCRQKGVTVDSDVLSSLQLRFISSNEYVVEVVCSQFSMDPIVIETKKLPQFVKKLPGNTGIVWGESASGIGLEVFGRKRAIVVEKQEIFYSPVDDRLSYGVGPSSSCQAYGFQCCQLETQLGLGDQYNGVNDCPLTCFSSCQSRPLVLSFTSDPFIDLETRVTTIGSGDSVTFSYVVNPFVADNIATVELDTGDGQTFQSTQLTGTFDHTYECQNMPCRYPARIKVVNSAGVESADLSVNNILIEVNN